MSEVQVFTAPQGSVLRTVIKDGEPWFVASDVCQILDVGSNQLLAGRRFTRAAPATLAPNMSSAATTETEASEASAAATASTQALSVDTVWRRENRIAGA